MSDTTSPAPPEWVVKRDGQVVPFDADKISRSLFAAAEAMGQADAFLSRELADSVVHFLSVEIEEPVPTTAQVADVVSKVVRELGHPALAIAYAGHRPQGYRESRSSAAPSAGVRAPTLPPGERVLRIPSGLPFAEAIRECGRQYALETIFTRDLLTLQNDGLIYFYGLDRPAELAASVLELHRAVEQEEGLVGLLETARRQGSSMVVLDSPEHLLAPAWPAPKPFAPGFARRVDRALRLAGMCAVVNLNAAVFPSWADDTVGGPLFHSARAHVAGLRDDQADQLAREWSSFGDTAVRVDWHLADRDFIPGSTARDRLLLRLQEVLRGANLAFVLDRQRRSLALAEGMTRRRSALLFQVALNLPRLAEWTGSTKDGDRFLDKLASLAGLAVSAGVQKREFLRNLARNTSGSLPVGADLTSGFLLDRAVLVVVPVGLDKLVETITGHGVAHGAASLELGRRVVQRLRDALRANTRNRDPEACVDGTIDVRSPETGPCEPGGLTPWDAGAAVPNQLRAAGALHTVAEAGTVIVMLEEARSSAVELLEVIKFAWEKTDVVRVRFVRGTASQPPLPFRDQF